MKTKYKILLIVIGIILVAGAAGGYLWYQNRGVKKVAVALSNGDASSPGLSTENADENAKSLSEQQQNASTLGASSGQSINLQTNLGQTNGSGGSSGKSSSSAPTVPSPDTFSQFDQYKDAKNALYQDIQVGSGAEAAVNKKVSVVYKGWLTNGTLFDQTKTDPSTGKLVAFTFTLGGGQVIPGWDQGINGMKVGGTRLLIVPPAVGYGATGNGPVPPNAVMVFQVQVVAVQ